MDSACFDGRMRKFRKTTSKFSVARIFFDSCTLQLTFYHRAGHLFFTNHLSG